MLTVSAFCAHLPAGRYTVAPWFYAGLEAAFTWSVEGTLAFRFDRVWHAKDRRRAPKVLILFHPGFGKDEEVPDGVTAGSVAFLVTFTLLVEDR